VTLFADESSFPLTKSFQSKTITMNEEIVDLQSGANSSDVLTLKQLNRFIRKNKDAGLNTLQYEVDYYAKFGFAFAPFVMALLGIPFSVSRQRSGGAMVNVGLCILLAFGYWALYSSSMALGKHGVMAPLLAAWIPNLLGGGLAVYLLMRLKR
jgi:lipopolysaccharide export system permease protein